MRSFSISIALFIALALSLTDTPRNRTAQTATALNANSQRLGDLRGLSETIPAAEQTLALRRKTLAPEHPDVAQALNELAELYTANGRYGDVERLFRERLAIDEKAFGPEHPNVAGALGSLADLYRALGRYTEAEPLLNRSIAIFQKALGPEHPALAQVLCNQASVLQAEGRYGEAEALVNRGLAIYQKVYGPEQPNVASALNNLASLYQAEGRYGEAEALMNRGIAIYNKALGPDHPMIADPLNNLGLLYQLEGRNADAEVLYKRSLAIREKALAPEHPNIAQSLNNLAGLYQLEGRYLDAEPLLQRSLAIREKSLGPDHPDVANTLNNLAGLYQAQGRNADAEPLFQRSLAIQQKAFGPENPLVLLATNNLAGVYAATGRTADAEQLVARSLAVREKVLGPDHPDVAESLNNLAGLYQVEGRDADAEPLFQRSLAIREKVFGPDHPDVARGFSNLAGFYVGRHDWARAAEYWRRSTGIFERRAGRGLSSDSGLRSKSKRETELYYWQFQGLVKVTDRLAPAGGNEHANLGHDMFVTAQWAQSSEAAASLAEMAARGGSNNPALAAVIRERQDLVGEWQSKDKQLIGAKSDTPDKRNASAEKKIADRLAAIDHRVTEIDALLKKNFPEYTALANPNPLSVADVQALLRDNEALVLFFDTNEFKPLPEETFVWAITKTDMRWVRSDLGTNALRQYVGALRCGLDYNAWRPANSACADLLKVSYSYSDAENGKPLPFDVARAGALYAALFGQVEDLIKDKQILIVPSGALTQLPFQVLVTERSDASRYGLRTHEVGLLGAELKNLPDDAKATLPNYGNAGVLVSKIVTGGPAESSGQIRQNDIIVALDHTAVTSVNEAVAAVHGHAPPSPLHLKISRDGKEFEADVVLGAQTVSEWVPQFIEPSNQRVPWFIRNNAVTVLPSVSSLKSLRQSGKASQAGHPLIGFGNPLLHGPDSRYAERAAEARSKQACPNMKLQQTARLMVKDRGVVPLMLRGGLADVMQIQTQDPLPETADELCAVALDLNADADAIHLGANATETAIKRLSDSGSLTNYKVVHFATHGALAGQVSGSAEPGLLLTPPDMATRTDDGYLSASEIAGLRLDADWVILSACNTAAGGANGAEALSGLAQAFFYAGARALLVSHWSVDSQATVKLITGAMSRMAGNSETGRAEAMRQSMLSLIDSGSVYAHPSNWAPFVVVGEGAAAK